MKNITKIAGVAAVALAFTQAVQAVPIVGNIGFGGNVTYDTGSAATASEVTSWSDTQVLAVSTGSTFASFITPIAAATFNNSVVWDFNDPSTVINNFWQAGGFTFTLDSSSILAQGGIPGNNGFVVVDGVGTVSGNGFGPTAMTWHFTSNDPSQPGANGPTWTFAATTNTQVPDGGSTVVLLGIALSGAALLRRKLMA